jgi:carnosine N-methyltransferase
MNMTAGDFITSYSGPENEDTFDAVVTVYFIDTAPNFIRYIETIRNVLKPGGLWINIGPLLWHFDGRAPTDTSSSHTTGTQSSQPHNSDIPNSSTTSEHHPPHPTKITQDTGIGNPGSFELPWDLTLQLIEHHGFNILESRTDLDPDRFGRYITDQASMGVNLYRCGFWVGRLGAGD